MNNLQDAQILKPDWVSAVLAGTERIVEFDVFVDSSITVSGKNLIENFIDEWKWQVTFPDYFLDGNFVSSDQKIFTIRASAHQFVQKEFYLKEFLSRIFSLSQNAQKICEMAASENTTLIEPRHFFSSDLGEKEILVAAGIRPRRLFFKKCIFVTQFHVDGKIAFHVEKLRESLPPTIKIEYQATTLEEVQEADRAGVDYISLKDFSVNETAMAVRTVRGRCILEMTGRYVKEENFSDILKTKVDGVSSDFILKMPNRVNIFVRS